ncbi:MAG: hypothetical protein IJO15_05810 [Clostridia bacterium]|nr:hypothetical protein [Clostridia bacterium]
MKKLKVILMLIVLSMCLTACKVTEKEKIETYKDEKSGVTFEYSNRFEKIEPVEDISLKINEQMDKKVELETSSCNTIMQNDEGEIILLKTIDNEALLTTDDEIKSELEKQRQDYKEIMNIAKDTKIIKNEIITVNEKLALDTQIESNGVRTRVLLIKLKDKTVELQYIAKTDKYNENNANFLETIKI